MIYGCKLDLLIIINDAKCASYVLYSSKTHCTEHIVPHLVESTAMLLSKHMNFLTFYELLSFAKPPNLLILNQR